MTARILVVDDVPANTRLLEAKLGAEYYQVATAHSGYDAIGLAQTWQPDLILLDVMMPEIDGYETCRRLKEDGRTLHIPVVMVTALSEPEERLRGLEAGADDFLTKPVDYDTLLARTKSLVRLKRLLDEWRVRGETARALGIGGDNLPPPSVSGARALVVDDFEPSTIGMQDALAHEGILAARATSEAEALQLAGAMDFDLIVLSLSLTNDDPMRLAARLRAAERTQNVPLLLVADPEQKDRMLRGFDIGANDWVLRPIDENEFRARARNQIRRKIYQDRLRADLGRVGIADLVLDRLERGADAVAQGFVPSLHRRLAGVDVGRERRGQDRFLGRGHYVYRDGSGGWYRTLGLGKHLLRIEVELAQRLTKNNGECGGDVEAARLGRDRNAEAGVARHCHRLGNAF